MLEDRDYMRAPEYGASRWRSVTVTLLIINLAVFLLQMMVPRNFPLDDYFGLSYAGLRRGYVWQLLTFQFLHGGLLHLALNSLGIFTFGLAVEQFLGAKRFLQLYLISGVVGGLVHVLGSLVLPQHFGVIVQGEYRLYAPVVGASAGLFGLIAAFATMFPERDLTVFLFFVFPIRVSAKVLASVFLGISILGIIIEKASIDKANIAHGAHAGGLLGGWLMLKFFARQTARPARVEEITPSPVFKSETDFVSKEVDPILEKISKHGIQSLTAAQRKTLEAARKKMEKR
jgi:membrane associated rhomboid family serine protease